MAASDPQGEMQFWKDGAPFRGVELGTNDGGEMQFWFNGLPFGWYFPAGAAVTVIKDMIAMGVIMFPR